MDKLGRDLIPGDRIRVWGADKYDTIRSLTPLSDWAQSSLGLKGRIAKFYSFSPGMTIFDKELFSVSEGEDRQYVPRTCYCR